MRDVFGRMVADYYDGELACRPIYERSDGHEQPAHCAWYFSEPADWPAVDREALGRLVGSERVLDLGCGPGRAGRFLQDRGQDVVGVDASWRAVAVASDRGLEEVVAGELASLPLGADAADSAVAFGSHVGAGGPEAFRSLLADLDRVLAPGGRIVADCYDPTRVTEPALRSYLDERAIDVDSIGIDASGDCAVGDGANGDRESAERTSADGTGSVRTSGDGLTTRQFRLRYDGAVGPWRTLLCCSPDALERVIEPSVWQLGERLRSDGARYWFELRRA